MTYNHGQQVFSRLLNSLRIIDEDIGVTYESSTIQVSAHEKRALRIYLNQDSYKYNDSGDKIHYSKIADKGESQLSVCFSTLSKSGAINLHKATVKE